MLFGETVDIALIPSDGSQPWFFRDVHFNASQAYEFSIDTTKWEWYQNDAIAIVDKNNKVKKSWRFHRKEYAPGECPECHGTHKCRKCNGQGYRIPKNLELLLHPGPGQSVGGQCDACGGTGSCMTCEIAYRKGAPGPSGLRPL